jgi:para-aminobenzoate synthetase component 1
MLNWLGRFNICCFLDNHQYAISPNAVECVAAAGVFSAMHPTLNHNMDAIERFTSLQQDWIFGHLGYDLKNEIEGLQSTHDDHIGFPEAFLFVPQFVILLNEGAVEIGSMTEDHEQVFLEIVKTLPGESGKNAISVNQRFSREEYVRVIRELKQHIQRGDCYEINFCQEFYAEKVSIDPIGTYLALSNISPNPFSVFYRLDNKYLLCASPERFLSRIGDRLISQPIKGTISRDINDPEHDHELKEKLSQSAKDKTENVMIVDLVRNDLSKVCKEGTVSVDELFGIYTFPQVYQMISTVSGELQKGVSFTEVVRSCFPMGSMTGAPKRRVMELIEKYERTARGIFSGSVGYISPGKNFDLNVVIRSIMYNAVTGYLSFMAGSGITASSDPEKEYEECLLKAEAIKKILGVPSDHHPSPE